MKNKIIILFVLVIVFAPSFAGAMFVPYFNINIVKNTVGGDGVFNFQWYHNQYDNGIFQIETADGSGAGSVMALINFANAGDTITVSEDPQAGWQYTGASCFSDNPQVTSQITPNGFSVTAYPYSSITCTLTNIKQNQRTPVLIVPGLLGTEILKEPEKLWPDSMRMLTNVGDEFMDILGFNGNLTPVDNSVNFGEILKREVTLDYAEGLINEFKNQGYVEGTGADATLFTFPYDWRYGVTGVYADGLPTAGKTNEDLLKEKIQEILQQTGADKVDVAAHSMGGLIVKKYVMDNPTSHKIGKAVFVGVPNTGAPKAVKVLLQGDNFNVLGLNDSEIKKISENMPASYDLLPSQQYYDTKGSFVQTIEEGQAGSLEPYIIEDLDYSQFKSFITTDHNLNSQAVGNAESLHTASFDNYDMRTAGVDVYAIDGCKTGTIGKIVERRFTTVLGDGVDYANPKIIPGDGTVPLESATNLPINAENKFYFLETSHGKMLSQNGGRQKIVNLISGSNLAVSNNLITQDIDKCRLDGKAISVFSPINIFVTDQNGSRLGLAEDGSIINEIPGADFEIWGEHKFVYLPDGQNYAINLAGTDTGTFTLKVQDIQNDAVIQTEVFRNLAVTPSLSGQVNLAAGTTTTLSLSSEAAPVLPSAVFEGEEPIDFQPPEVVIEFDPVKKDLKFTGKDNVSSADKILVQDNDDTITLADQAGNTTEIFLQDKNRKRRMLAELKQIKYNGISTSLIKNSMKFYWSLDKNKNIKNLYQRVTAKSGYNILAIFDGQATKLDGRDASGKVAGILPGLKIIKITTNKGDLSWSY